MDIDLEPGKYVVAVSGGVDSVVLLDSLAKQTDKYELVVAHFDHGIRKESKNDRLFVENLAKKHGLEFHFGEGKLGPKASEALAREKRYGFLRRIKTKINARAIVTAHHRNDLIETAIINVLRGTGRKGMSSLKSTGEIKRPLLSYDKKELIEYANKNGLAWREDKTNLDQKYLRNYVRHQIVTEMDDEQKSKLLEAIKNSKALNKKIDDLLDRLSDEVFGKNQVNRTKFLALPHELSKEMLAHWLRQKDIAFDKRTLERLVVFIKIAKKGTRADINKSYVLSADKNFISLRRTQSV
jgi:tRNA(Ile)-lysidine synthase